MKKILIVKSNYYKEISNNLVINAKNNLKAVKFKVFVVEVPGVHEIPVTIRKNIKKFDAFVALGCVIKGQTPHFDLICSSTFNAIMKLSVDFCKPIGNGIITLLIYLKRKKEVKNLKITNPIKVQKLLKRLYQF